MKTFNFKTFLSPLTWRYGSEEMRYIFSEENKYRLWRKIWVALAHAQHKYGLVTDEELADLKIHENEINIERILEIEKDTKHDVVAAIKEFAERAKTGGGKIHLGATSMDIVDNADMIRVNQAFEILEKRLRKILKILSEKIGQTADFTCLGYTHIQPAEPTTIGYRLSLYGQDFLNDYQILQFVKKIIKSKGFKGAVGTAASYASFVKEDVAEFEKLVADKLEIEPVLISGQVYPRKFDYLIMTAIASIASSCAKFAADLRILQTPAIGEWSEPFGARQVGSSAMPYKKNPLDSEKICSLARLVGQLPAVALENASHSYLERTLDDSANKRIFMPEGFLSTEEILITVRKILEGLVINKERIKHNLSQYGVFAATESIIIEAVRAGADRQQMHEIIREISMRAWEKIQQGKDNPMETLLLKNEEILKYLSEEKIKELLNIENHIGNAPERAKKLTEKIIKIINN